jgi:hypothetical protein
MRPTSASWYRRRTTRILCFWMRSSILAAVAGHTIGLAGAASTMVPVWRILALAETPTPPPPPCWHDHHNHDSNSIVCTATTTNFTTSVIGRKQGSNNYPPIYDVALCQLLQQRPPYQIRVLASTTNSQQQAQDPLRMAADAYDHRARRGIVPPNDAAAPMISVVPGPLPQQQHATGRRRSGGGPAVAEQQRMGGPDRDHASTRSMILRPDKRNNAAAAVPWTDTRAALYVRLVWIAVLWTLLMLSQ